MAKRQKDNLEPRVENRKARHDYEVLSSLECGIELLGSEVKSLRAGGGQIADGYAEIQAGQLYLHGLHIEPYRLSALAYNHEPRRVRRLLAHKREIRRLADDVSVRGVTLIPLGLYWKDGRVKVEVATAKGKKQHDKRESLKRKAMDDDIRRAMTHRG